MAKEKWQEKFTEADKLFADRKKEMLKDGIYKDPGKFFEWASKTTEELVKVSNIFGASQVALRAIDGIDLVDDGSKYLQMIIDYANSLGITIDGHQTGSLRFQTSLITLKYLENLAASTSK